MSSDADLEPHTRGVGDISSLTDEQLVDAIQHSEDVRRRGRERTGRLLAELYRRGRLSWPAIARRTSIRQTTAYELAQPFLVADDREEQTPS